MTQATLAVDLEDARALLRSVRVCGRASVGGNDWRRLLELEATLQRIVYHLEGQQGGEGPAAGATTKGSGV